MAARRSGVFLEYEPTSLLQNGGAPLMENGSEEGDVRIPASTQPLAPSNEFSQLNIQHQDFTSALNFDRMSEQLELLNQQGDSAVESEGGEVWNQVIANEQAKLLETFQSMRQWQQQQQAALMRQQQEQMHKLLAEQDRITSLMGTQRESHWKTPESSPTKASRSKTALSPHVQPYVAISYNQRNTSINEPEYDTDDGVYPLASDSQGNLSSQQDISEVETSDEASAATNYDEMPIKSVTKTFEQLLEEQLANEMAQSSQGEAPGNKPPVRYLKRGEGLSRFNLKENITPQKEWKPSTKNRQPLVDYSKPVLKRKPREPTPPETKRKSKAVNVVARKVATVPAQSPSKGLRRSNTMPTKKPDSKPEKPQKRLSNEPQSMASSGSNKQKSPQTSGALRTNKTISSSVQVNSRKPVMPVAGRPISAMDMSTNHLHKPTSPRKIPTPSPIKHGRQPNSNSLTTGTHDRSSIAPRKPVDSSFHSNILHRVTNEAVETEELQVFEMLEQFADGDDSFRSDCTLVKKAWKPKTGLSPMIKSQIAEAKQADALIPSVSDLEDHNTDSSPKTTQPEGRCEDDENLAEPLDHSTVSSVDHQSTNESMLNSHDSEGEDGYAPASVESPPVRKEAETIPIKRKIAYAKPPRKLDENSDNIESTNAVFTHVSTRALPAETAVVLPERPSKPVFIDESAEWDNDSTLNTPAKERFHKYLSDYEETPEPKHRQPETSKPVIQSERLSTLPSQSEHAPTLTSQSKPSLVENSDTESLSHNNAPSSGAREVGDAADAPASSSDEEEDPPQSQLLQKLFPSLKSAHPSKPKSEEKKEEVIKTTSQTSAAQSTPDASAEVQALVSMTPTLKSKLMDLEKEIERFRMENTELAKLKKEREESVAKLRKEMSDFQSQRDEELQRLNEYKAQETKKLKNDRKLFETWQKQQQLIVNKKDKQEIEALTHELEELKAESKRKEQRWTANTSRLRDRVETLEKEKQDLKAKVEELEQINVAQQHLWKQAESNSKKHSITQVAKKVDEQWTKIMDTVENQPSSSSSSRQGRRTPLASNTHSLNVKNKQTSQPGAVTQTVSSSRVGGKNSKVLTSDQSASSSERVKPASGALKKMSAAHTEPVIGSIYPDDTDNDITTDSDMAHTEEEDKKALINGLLADLSPRKRENRTRQSGKVRPVSAQHRRKTSRDRTASRDRHTSYDRIQSRDRNKSRDRVAGKERDVPALPLDRQEPDGRSSRQGRIEDKSDMKLTPQSSTDQSGSRHTSTDRYGKRDSESGGERQRSGQSLDRGNNTGSSEPPTVIEILEDGRRSRRERPQTSPPRRNRNISPLRRSQSSRDRSADRPSLNRGYSTEMLDDRQPSSPTKYDGHMEVKENMLHGINKYGRGSPSRVSRVSPRRRRSPERRVSRRADSRDRMDSDSSRDRRGRNDSLSSLGRGTSTERDGRQSRRSKDWVPTIDISEGRNTVDSRMNSIGSKKSLSSSMGSGDDSSPIRAARLHRGDENNYQETTYPDGKRERLYRNGAREVFFPNGTHKEISSDGKNVVVKFFNGDKKHILPDQSIVYYYAEAKTTHTTYPDGVEIVHFTNKQVEKTFPSGMKEIVFPDGAIKYLHPDGKEETNFIDGTVVRVVNGVKILEMPNGQKEIHTNSYKRREYPDGTVKTVYNDGRQETKYSNGRVRVKNLKGDVIVDTIS